MQELNSLSIPEAAKMYEVAGWTITPLRPQSKAAYMPGWNQPGALKINAEYWQQHPTDNIGVILEPSNVCILDIDMLPEFLIAVRSIGLTPNEDSKPFWECSTAGIKSGKPNKGKLVFQKPAGVELKYHKLLWNNPGGGTHTVFELRTGYVQDVLPPSIHPDTGKPYEWVGGLIEPMPADLLLLWQEWATFEPALQKADRFYIEPKPPQRGRPRTAAPGRDFIGEWNRQQNLGFMLEYFGYNRIGRRYLSPSSHSGTPGVILSDDGSTFYSFGESDYFADGHQHNAFDLLLHYKHNDDMRAAIDEIKRDMGITKIKDRDLLETARRLLGGCEQ